jgi:hypothetical protein
MVLTSRRTQTLGWRMGPMGVDFFLVLLFEAEYELDGDDSAFGAFDFEGGG